MEKTETVIEAWGTDRFPETLKEFLNREVQTWSEIQDLCHSFANDISVQDLGTIEDRDDKIVADFTVSFTDVQMAVCCEVQPGQSKSVGAKVTIDRNTGAYSLKLGVFWDTDNDGY